jgi:hypothetical protein
MMDNKSVFGNDFDYHSTAALTQQDRAVLDNVESALANGLQIKKWWEQTEATHSYADRFETVNTFNRPDRSFAFFDQALLNGQPQPVMGDVIELFYDRPKAPTEPAASAWMRDQIREFILHYFMRISDFRRPQAYVSPTHPAPPPWLRPLSWCPEAYPAQRGFGYEQYYYKLRDSGQVGKFPEAERFAIVDLRELEQKYEWIVLRVRIFDFNLTFRPLGQELPQVVVPLREHQWVVMSRDFILNEDYPEPGVLGAYGYGYAVFTNPADQSLLAYGPGYFDTGFTLFNFRVLASGETCVQLVFVVNRPTRILNLSFNPVTWSFTLADLVSFGLPSRLFAPLQAMFAQLPGMGSGPDPVFSIIDMANLFTRGLAAQELCISRDDLEKAFLVQHFMQNYDLIVGSLQTWRQIPNWLDSAALPAWVVTGRNA